MLKSFISLLKHCVDEVFTEKMATHYITGISKVVYLKDGSAHRDGDKPARFFFNRETRRILREEFYKNGVLHREDGKPAIIIYNNDGSVDGYLNRSEYVQNKPCWKAFLASQHHG